jgi:N-methylhydantoinase A
MAQAIREITVRKGLDPRECALVAFGGAGAQHAAAVAEQLGVREVVIPVHGSVLSAVGLLTAATRITSARALLLPLEGLVSPAVEDAFVELGAESAARLGGAAEGAEVIAERFLGLRYVGQTHEVPVAFAADVEVVRERFEADHERLFGTRLGDPIELVDCWLTLTIPRPVPPGIWRYRRGERAAAGVAERRVLLVDDVVDVHERGALEGAVDGPCLVEEEQSVTWVPEGATVRPVSGHLVVELQA